VYDTIRIHLVADLYDGTDVHRSQLWHYCPYDTPSCRFIHEYSVPESARLGAHNLAACRPSVGIDRRRMELYAVWVQFDPANTDPVTGLCRADLWAARSNDTGHTWAEPVRLTGPDTFSRQFAFLAEVVDETLHLLCFADRVAGVWEQGEGPQTTNPVLQLSVPVAMLPQAVEQSPAPRRAALGPSLLRGELQLGIIDRVTAFDRSGRQVAQTGSNRAGQHLVPGVYFLRSDTESGPVWTRVTKVR
jgi:uncharacterized protein (DUF2237 family)